VAGAAVNPFDPLHLDDDDEPVVTTSDTYDTPSLSDLPILPPPPTTLGEVEENLREVATALMHIEPRSNLNPKAKEYQTPTSMPIPPPMPTFLPETPTMPRPTFNTSPPSNSSFLNFEYPDTSNINREFDEPLDFNAGYNSFEDDFTGDENHGYNPHLYEPYLQFPLVNCEATFSIANSTRKSNKSEVRKEIKEQTAFIVTQDMNGWKDEEKIKSTIEIMIRDNIGAYLIQETWDLNYDARDIRGYLVLHHNYNA